MVQPHADLAPGGSVPSMIPPLERRPGLTNAAAGLLMLALFLVECRLSGTFPAAILITGLAAYLTLCLVSLESAFLVLVLATPFSRETRIPGTGSALQIPTEPMLLLAILVWTVRIMARGSHRWAQARLTRLLLVALAACLLSLAFADFQLKGLKSVANATWYALFGIFVMNNFRDRRRLLALAAVLLAAGAALLLYSLIGVARGRFEPVMGIWYAWPFFTEHGSFAAFLSFPCAMALALALESRGMPRVLLGGLALALGGQIVLSLTRAAWIGLLTLPPLLLLTLPRRLLRPATIVPGLAGVLILAWLFVQGGATHQLGKTTRTITDPTNVSNLERVNRWYAGYRMFREHPVTGIGFGTYPENYLHYRRIPLGTDQSGMRMGVHSEYLRVLAETGVVGALTAALSLGALAGIAVRAIRRSVDPMLRTIAIGLTGGLLTYLAHGFLNNFLEFDKLAVPVWLAIGGLGAIESLAPPGSSTGPDTTAALVGPNG